MEDEIKKELEPGITARDKVELDQILRDSLKAWEIVTINWAKLVSLQRHQANPNIDEASKHAYNAQNEINGIRDHIKLALGIEV
jgi:hypothetical protein